MGDVSATGILVPSTPTQPTIVTDGDDVTTIVHSAQENRYMFRLAAKIVPAGYVATIVGAREAVTIGYDPGKIVLEVGARKAKAPGKVIEVAGNIIEAARAGMKDAAKILRGFGRMAAHVGQRVGIEPGDYPFGPTQLPDWADADELCAAAYGLLGYEPTGDAPADNTYSYPFEQLVVSPFWTPPDGNVSRHLRIRPPGGQQLVPPILGDQPPPGGITTWNGTEPGLLYTPPYTTSYIPPNGGKPPGSPLGGMGVWRDNNRLPWYAQGIAANMDYDVPGPCSVEMWCTVFQTDPCSRINLDNILSNDNDCASFASIGPENLFALMFPLYRYWRVAGSIDIDMYPRKSKHFCPTTKPKRKSSKKSEASE